MCFWQYLWPPELLMLYKVTENAAVARVGHKGRISLKLEDLLSPILRLFRNTIGKKTCKV